MKIVRKFVWELVLIDLTVLQTDDISLAQFASLGGGGGGGQILTNRSTVPANILDSFKGGGGGGGSNVTSPSSNNDMGLGKSNSANLSSSSSNLSGNVIGASNVNNQPTQHVSRGKLKVFLFKDISQFTHTLYGVLRKNFL